MDTKGTGPSAPAVFFSIMLDRRLRPRARRCIASIFYNFFFCQYRAALAGKFNKKKAIPVSRVDHELDGLIPFSPGWISVYLDFVGFWVRMMGFLMTRFGGKGRDEAADFMDAMGALYRFAGDVYRKNLSTTARPFYIRRPRFLLLHLFDPHLMCIPSLHVMVAILTYTRFKAAMEKLDGGFSPLPAEYRRGAQDITEAILYVKQHSVNCVAAAMYAMSCFDGAAFPPEEAASFCSGLFAGESRRTVNLPRIGGEAGDAARRHILALYLSFMGRPGGGPWEQPLLDFLRPLRK
jgi:hypothetical protein